MARQHRDGWQADVIGPDGKRIRKQFSTEEAAKAWEASFAPATMTPEHRPTLLDYVKPRIELIWGKGSKHGDANYRKIQHLHKDMPCALEDISQREIDTLIMALQKAGDTGGTINRKLAAVSKAMKHAKRAGFFKRDLPEFPRQKEPKGRIRYLTVEVERAVSEELRLFNPKYPDFVAFMCDTGLRLSNGLDLLWKDVKIAKGKNSRNTVTVWENKQDEPQTIPLTIRATEALERQDKDASGPWKWLNPWTFRQHLKSAADAAGMGNDIVIHTFRHTCASRLALRGVDIRRIQQFMGHKTLTMTLRYAHLMPKALDTCADALDSLEMETA